MTTRLQLALDASAGSASVALFADGTLVQSEHIDRKGSAELLAPTVARLLTAARCQARELTDVIVGAGPGSFTGLRVAAAFGKGLARGASARLHAVPSLPLIAAADPDAPIGVYFTVLDALRGEWFMQAVARHNATRWEVLGPMERLRIATVHERAAVAGATIVGPPVDVTQQPHARAALIIGAVPVALDAWEPDYGRLAEAQVVWETTHARPLPSA